MVRAFFIAAALGAAAWAFPSLAQEPAAANAEALIEKQRSMLGVSQRSCAGVQDEIVVCGRRNPDRYRIPPEQRQDGPTVSEERGSLLNPRCAAPGPGGCGTKLIPLLTLTADGVKLGPPRPKK